MANTTDFIGAVYDELVKLLGITDTNPSIIMQMAWPGFSLVPEDFKRSDTPNGPYDPEVAQETFSHLSNIAPILNKTRYENSGYEVDDLYEILISSAIPWGATPDTLETNPTNKLFSDAQYEFLQARRGIHDDPNAFYYPCTATPSTWYDEATAQFWPTLSIKSSDVKPSTPTSAFVKAGGVALTNQSVWKLRPTSADSSAIKASIQQAAVMKRPQVTFARPGTLVTPTTRPPSRDTMEAHRTVSVSGYTRPGGPVVLIDDAVNSVIRARNGRTLFTQKNRPVNIYTNVNLSTQVQPLDLTQKRLDLRSLNITNRFVLKDLINQQLPIKPPSTTGGFSISFKYCRVDIDRAWFKLALLSTKNWYMFGTMAGDYSTGTDKNNSGMFPLLPTSFIAIRDLKITANWSQEDRQNLTKATAFGFFDIHDSTLNSNTLEVKGLQILGWISKLMPQLPPISPP